MELVRLVDGRSCTSSRLLAQRFNKEHKSVLRAIANLECSQEFNRRNFAPIFFTDNYGRKQPEYSITKDGFTFLAVGFTGKEAAKFKEEFINEFNRLDDLIRSNLSQSQLPNFIERYKSNYHKIDKNCFSVITEMFVRLYSALEAVGYVIPDKGLHAKKMMPDISVGRGFADFLRTQKSEFIADCKSYKHSFPDDRPQVDANMYPIEALPLFIRYVNEVWIPTKAYVYFKGKDDNALNYLPKLLER